MLGRIGKWMTILSVPIVASTGWALAHHDFWVQIYCGWSLRRSRLSAKIVSWTSIEA